MRIDPPPSSQPLRARSYWSARARPAGSSGDGRAGSPDAVTSSGSSSGRTPENGLWVASQRPPSGSHWYIGNRWTQAYARTFGSARPEPLAELHPEPAEDVGRDRGAVGHDQDQVALRGPGPLDQGAFGVVGQELGDRALDLAAGLEGQVREPLGAEPLRPLGQLVDLAARDRGQPGRHDGLHPSARGEGVVEHPEPRRRCARGIGEDGRKVDELHPEPQVRLVRAEPLEGLVVGQDRERDLLDRPVGRGRAARPRSPSPRRSP